MRKIFGHFLLASAFAGLIAILFRNKKEKNEYPELEPKDGYGVGV